MNKKFIMKKAVAMARKLEGDWNARMAIALKTVWRMVKVAEKANKAEQEEVKFNEWAKYGYHRVYFEGAFHYEDKVRNGITGKLVEVTVSVHIKGFYDIEKGYIKFDKCSARHKEDARNYVLNKLANMKFNLKVTA